MQQSVEFALGMPSKEEDRAALRELVGQLLPAKYPDGAECKCHKCGMEIHVGPLTHKKMQENTNVKPVCVMCLALIQRTTGGSMNPINLNNPNSRLESLWDE